MSNFIGVVLAGGRSSRMGKDKSQLKYQGLTFIEHQVRLLRNCGATNVYISGNNIESFSIIPDRFPNLGPLSGIYSTLQFNELDALFVPIDMPLLPQAHLQKLTQTSKELSQYQGFPFPLFVKNTSQIKQYLAEVLDDDKAKRSIKGFIERFDCESMPVDEPSVFSNINTPLDYQRLITQK